MAFPTTGILDNFNRADGALGANWGRPYSNLLGEWAVSGNQCVAGALQNGAVANYWSAATFGADSEVYAIRISGGFSIALRLADVTGTSPDGYYNDTSAGSINRLDNGATTQLGATFTGVTTNGNSAGFEAIGSTFKAYEKSGGTWAELASRTDSTYSAAGYLWITCSLQGNTLDDFGGGTVIVAEQSVVPILMQQYRARRN